MVMYKRSHHTVITSNGHVKPRRPSRPRFAVRDIAIIWVAALTLSWLMGLGVVKLLRLIDGVLSRG